MGEEEVALLTEETSRSVDEVNERRTIEFPRSLDVNEMEDLFGYIVDNGYRQIRFYPTHMRATFGRGHEDNGDFSIGLEGEVEKEFGNGSFYNIPFRCRVNLEELFTFDAIEFKFEPGQTLEDIPMKTVQVWDDVRGQVDNYFS
ncbi:MAG: hypothetical protein KAT43_02195 [Nanoarchaeota archaeon]|nr:hypothetical protein [Nanoarchaeota archaeon]